MTRLTLAGAALALVALAAPALAQPAPSMGFFITSANPGKGGDLGGLAGADAHCQALAQAAGAGNRSWRAYLSTQGAGAENARDRIGRGPWRNARGEVVADSLQELHDGAPKLTKQTALTERGAVVNGRGDTPNMHDILTGSQPDGTAFAAGEDRTCGNWTSGDAGSAMLGHSDRIGLNDSPPMKSWNSSHPSRGCTMEALKATGGAGLLYCFAAD
ncbi:hypothetical protein [Roseicella frigidaeris]|uniref:Lectin n=1 Tax=Roseicella frigidaeris TaxID=2230885 RepID=A0A327MCY8_9PROT|nr:hypothetical protein [Roseicella frigidaeris]RAI59903.1 hypothetical protein DOO78_06565 [Roseicella frigidaeris]